MAEKKSKSTNSNKETKKRNSAKTQTVKRNVQEEESSYALEIAIWVIGAII